jgi:ABC-type nitrate/sulfonate/bicarbonate transport system substrate-binding protein
VDASGQLLNGRTFNGTKQFKQLMLEEPRVVARCLAAKLVTYATGHATEPGDILALVHLGNSYELEPVPAVAGAAGGVAAAALAAVTPLLAGDTVESELHVVSVTNGPSGKTVAVDALKSGYGIVLYQILKDKGGLEYDKDYKAISVGNTDKRIEAMRGEKAVAAIIGSPQDMAVEREGYRMLADAAQELGAYQGTAFVTRRPYAAQKEADLVAFARAMSKAQDHVFANKADAIEVLKKYAKGLTDAEAEKLYKRLIGPGGLNPRGAINPKAIETVLKIRETYGEPLKKMGPMSRYVDTAIYDKAVAGK